MAKSALKEVARRLASGIDVKAAVSGLDAEHHAFQMAESGAWVLLSSNKSSLKHSRIVQIATDDFADIGDDLIHPFDVILCQRNLSAYRHAHARQLLSGIVGKLKIGGKLFISLLGIHTELGDHYPDGDKLVCDRFSCLPDFLADRHDVEGPVCLYSERDLFSMLLDVGCVITTTSTSSLGHVRGIAVRI